MKFSAWFGGKLKGTEYSFLIDFLNMCVFIFLILSMRCYEQEK